MEFLKGRRADTVEHRFLALDECLHVFASQLLDRAYPVDHRVTVGPSEARQQGQVVELFQATKTSAVSENE